MPQEFRRIVTGHDAEGRSIILSDGPPAPIAEFWVTDGAPADNSTSGDAAKRPRKLEPPPNGSKFRFFMVEPEDPSIPAPQREEMAVRRFEAMGASHCRVDTRRHPAMHKTSTVDYIIVLSGQVTMLLDKAEVELKAVRRRDPARNQPCVGEQGQGASAAGGGADRRETCVGLSR